MPTATEATSPFAISDEMIDDILGTALEGGSNYWCGRGSSRGQHDVMLLTAWPEGAEFASQAVSRGAILAIPVYDELEDDVEWRGLDRAAMVRGIRAAAKHWKQTPARFYDEHDADAADVALQFALFGEVVYG